MFIDMHIEKKNVIITERKREEDLMRRKRINSIRKILILNRNNMLYTHTHGFKIISRVLVL